jgi:hypothetical protein
MRLRGVGTKLRSAPTAAFVGPDRSRARSHAGERRRFRRRVIILDVIGFILIAAAEVIDQKLLQEYLVSGAAKTVHAILGVLGASGEAALVAGLLAVTVDLYLKRRLTEEITEDVSAYVMSRALPRLLQDEVDSFCREHSVRTELDLNYTFSEVLGDPAYILMTVLFRFQVMNLTDESQPFEHIASVQKVRNFAGEPMILIPEVGGRYVDDENGTPADYHEEGDLGTDSKDGAYRIWRKTVWIPPKGSGTQAFFWSYRRQVLPREFQDTFILTNAAIRPRLEVHCPEWMEINATFGHRLRADEFTSGNPKFWVLNGGMPPYSSISIEWRNKGRQTPVVPLAPVSSPT